MSRLSHAALLGLIVALLPVRLFLSTIGDVLADFLFAYFIYHISSARNESALEHGRPRQKVLLLQWFVVFVLMFSCAATLPHYVPGDQKWAAVEFLSENSILKYTPLHIGLNCVLSERRPDAAFQYMLYAAVPALLVSCITYFYCNYFLCENFRMNRAINTTHVSLLIFLFGVMSATSYNFMVLQGSLRFWTLCETSGEGHVFQAFVGCVLFEFIATIFLLLLSQQILIAYFQGRAGRAA